MRQWRKSIVDSRAAEVLGWVSVGLGLAGLLAPRRMTRLTGLQKPGLLALVGARELSSGVGLLSQRNQEPAGHYASRTNSAKPAVHLDRTIIVNKGHRECYGEISTTTGQPSGRRSVLGRLFPEGRRSNQGDARSQPKRTTSRRESRATA